MIYDNVDHKYKILTIQNILSLKIHTCIELNWVLYYSIGLLILIINFLKVLRAEREIKCFRSYWTVFLQNRTFTFTKLILVLTISLWYLQKRSNFSNARIISRLRLICRQNSLCRSIFAFGEYKDVSNSVFQVFLYFVILIHNDFDLGIIYF